MKKQIWEIGGCLSLQLNNLSDKIIGGVCGETLTWHLDNNSLVIEGLGDMYDYDSAEDAPWASVAEEVTSIILPDEITRIGNNAFAACSNVGELTFDDNDCVFGKNAFNSKTKTYLIIDDAQKKDFAMHPNTYYQIIIKRKLNSTNYGTIVMPFAPNSETRKKFKFYQIGGFDGESLTYQQSYTPSANMPYLYKNADADESKWASEIASVYYETIQATEKPEQTKDGFTLIGSYKNLFIDDPEQLPYLYVMSGGKLMNYTTNLTITPFRAYFKGIKYDDWVNGNT